MDLRAGHCLRNRQYHSDDGWRRRRLKPSSAIACCIDCRVTCTATSTHQAALTKRDLFGHTNTNLSRSSAPAVPTRLPLTLEAVFVGSAPEESAPSFPNAASGANCMAREISYPAMRGCTKWSRHRLFWSAQVRGRHLRLSPNSKRKPVLPHSLPGQRQLRRLQQEQRRRFFNNLAQNSRKILMPRWNDWVSVGTVAAAIESATSPTTPI